MRNAVVCKTRSKNRNETVSFVNEYSYNSIRTQCLRSKIIPIAKQLRLVEKKKFTTKHDEIEVVRRGYLQD